MGPTTDYSGTMAENVLDPKVLMARILAGDLLSATVGESSAKVDNFSGWLFAGFGAAVGLIFANLDSVAAHVTSEKIRCAAMLFVWSIPAAVLQRYLAVIVSSGAAGAKWGREIFAIRGISADQVDLNTLVLEMCRPFPKIVVSWLFRQINASDFMKISLIFFWIGIVQSFFTVVQVCLLFAATLIIASALVA